MGLSWRVVLAVLYVGWVLACVFAFHGGWPVLGFFAVWGVVWLAFSGFWRWADETRRALLHRHGYD